MWLKSEYKSFIFISAKKKTVATLETTPIKNLNNFWEYENKKNEYFHFHLCMKDTKRTVLLCVLGI